MLPDGKPHRSPPPEWALARLFNGSAQDDWPRATSALAIWSNHPEPCDEHGTRWWSVPHVERNARRPGVWRGRLPVYTQRTDAGARAAEFGGRIVHARSSRPGTYPRERVQPIQRGSPPATRLRRVFLDDTLDFVRTVPYHTVRARPGVGTSISSRLSCTGPGSTTARPRLTPLRQEVSAAPHGQPRRAAWIA